MRKLTRLSSLQETKSLATHPLKKHPQSLILIEIKITRKQEYIGKAEQVLCRYISYYCQLRNGSMIYHLFVFSLHWFKDIYREDIF